MQEENPQPSLPQYDPSQPNFTPYSGSELTPQKQKTLVGVWLIILWCTGSALFSFFSKNQSSILSSITMILDVMVAVGLIFKLNLARKILIWLMGITVAISIISMALLVATNSKYTKAKQQYDAAATAISSSSAVDITLKQQLNDQQAQIATLNKQLGKYFSYMYYFLSVEIVLGIATIVYLELPGVKENFTDLEN